MDLAGAQTLVTGASGGLGDAIARACAARGAQLILAGRREERLQALAAELGAEVVVADLANRDDVARLVDAVRELDVLVSNAGLPAGGTVETFSTEQIDRALEVNLRAPIVLSRHFTPAMVERGRGHVVFVSSAAAAFPTPGLAIYNATKSALASYGLSLRGELAARGVGVSVVYPGPIRNAGMCAETGPAASEGDAYEVPGRRRRRSCPSRRDQSRRGDGRTSCPASGGSLWPKRPRRRREPRPSPRCVRTD